MIGLLVVLLFVSAFGSIEVNVGVAREKFQAVKSLDYSYEYKSGACFCTEEAFKWKIVRVSGGVVSSVVLKETGEPFAYSPGTVEDIFQAVADALANNKLVEANFDPVFGFPVGDVKIDLDAFAYDGGHWWIFSNFTLLSPCVALPDCVTCTVGSCVWASAGCSASTACSTGDCLRSVDQCPPLLCAADTRRCSDGSLVSRDTHNNCHFKDCPLLTACATDVLKCLDGTTHSRDPKNDCEFPSCPSVACAADSQQCPDGSWVSRDPLNDCRFSECPPIFCAADVQKCPDGTFVSRDPKQGCTFPPCSAPACPEDIRQCLDGSWVIRDPAHNCEFPECAVGACPGDVRQCPDGSWIPRDPANGCKFAPCPSVICTADVRRCPDGSWVGPDAKNNCKIPSCPPVVCTTNAKRCPDGNWVSPDAKNGCKMPDCPSPVVCTQEAKLCPDGSAVGRDSMRGCAFAPCPGEVIPFITRHKKELERYLCLKTLFTEVEIMDTTDGDEDILLRVVMPENNYQQMERLKKGMASYLGIHPSRFTVLRVEAYLQKRASSQWLVALTVDEYSAAGLGTLPSIAMTVALVIGWLWI